MAMDTYKAPQGTTYVCGACGKYNEYRDDVGDEACFLNSFLAMKDTLKFSADGRVLTAQQVEIA